MVQMRQNEGKKEKFQSFFLLIICKNPLVLVSVLLKQFDFFRIEMKNYFIAFYANILRN